ncbi:MAG: tetratricopeptide repeat protein [Spirochaetota bacterium]
MSEKARGLRTAERLFRRGRYAEVIHHLESQVFAYRENARFYELLGFSCLRTGDYGGAYSFLSRSAQLDKENAQVLDGLAVAELKRRRPTDAIQTWLDALEINPNDRLARKGLNLVRRAEHPLTLAQELSEREVSALLPPEPRQRLVVRRVSIGVAVVAALGAASYLVAERGLLDRLDAAPPREGEELTRFQQEPEEWIDFEGEFRYVYTEAEVEDIFDRAARYFHDFRDNLARREINRILNSNASERVKERATLLIDYIQEPDFNSFQDGFSYTEVAAEPWLYEGCYVRWRGRVTNLRVDDSIRFDLMVGYESGRVLEGVVRVVVPFGVSLDSGDSAELIGRVETEDERLSRLEAVSIRRLIGEE